MIEAENHQLKTHIRLETSPGTDPDPHGTTRTRMGDVALGNSVETEAVVDLNERRISQLDAEILEHTDEILRMTDSLSDGVAPSSTMTIAQRQECIKSLKAEKQQIEKIRDAHRDRVVAAADAQAWQEFEGFQARMPEGVYHPALND